MRYIRFLKPPRIVDPEDPKNTRITCLITITSDLGESFLPEDLHLDVTLHSPKGVVRGTGVRWPAGKRSLPIVLPLPRGRDKWPATISVIASNGHIFDVSDSACSSRSRGVVSAGSGPLDPSKGLIEAPRFVERLLGRENRQVLRIWEETGESIARHLWDAGIMLSSHLSELASVSDDSPLARALKPNEGRERMQILELGTGCGIVGISLVQAIAKADVLLSDLPEAAEIVSRNIREAKPAKDSTLTFHTLDWEEKLPTSLTSRSGCAHCDRFDLIVAADCTYNADSSPALVRTFSNLVRLSPEASVVIAMKMRHSSEEVFFDLMSDAGFEEKQKRNLPLPGDNELGEEEVHVFLYQHRDMTLARIALLNDTCRSSKS